MPMRSKPGKQPLILIVDDDEAHRKLFAEVVHSLGLRVAEAGSADEAWHRIADEHPGLILLDVRLPGKSGLEILPDLKKKYPDIPIILITAYGDVREAVEAMKIGAVDYLLKPVDLEELETVILDHVGRGEELATKSRLPPLPPHVVCVSAAFQKVLETAYLVAQSDAPVLILGPSGSGKEVVARLIRDWSSRREGPFVAANCAGLPESLIESELFGHVAGAFTGATADRMGYFRAAHGGTLFLDEIGELPLSVQAKLLRALETGEIIPVGSEKPVRTDFRLLAATNRNLEEFVKTGRFREDLYYRINVVELTVPPLKERREDILPLAEFFGRQFARQPVRFSPQAMAALLSYHWPGNVRQLRNAIQRACLLAQGNIILPEHLPPEVAALASSGHEATQECEEGRLSAVERATILSTLAECGGNRTLAARKLGISRRALIYKLKALEALSPPSGGDQSR
ncbi:Response regulator of zinc sigma-54-dependent two-component system [Thermogutta terrifontis]|uniref:Response regulator of zinc sigma-54-dependent two-component system n=1 Tax=Thermogutta terrifontis TaxID=1331910 RepID=A0A286RIJ7_9BACT|nr:sigma-54 dependent transcriptional regulator [Thermogutta terrifontis]ASV75785.1 Response regulator of zinc sigma-54-dependent two-component system [Thermogutta terrifontis]